MCAYLTTGLFIHSKSPGDMHLSWADAYVCGYMSTSVYLNVDLCGH
jgi:hypothetical protein